MGGDGGTYPPTAQTLRLYKKKENHKGGEDPGRVGRDRATICNLSHLPLVKPIVMDQMGNLYNKTAVLEYLLEKKEVPVYRHLRNLKDVIELRIEFLDGKQGSEIGTQSSFVCPVSGLEFNGRRRFYAMRGCGCVVSENAMQTMGEAKQGKEKEGKQQKSEKDGDDDDTKENKSSDDNKKEEEEESETCIACGKASSAFYGKDIGVNNVHEDFKSYLYKIPINPTITEQDQLRELMMEQRTRIKAEKAEIKREKKRKKAEEGGMVACTNSSCTHTLSSTSKFCSECGTSVGEGVVTKKKKKKMKQAPQKVKQTVTEVRAEKDERFKSKAFSSMFLPADYDPRAPLDKQFMMGISTKPISQNSMV